MYSKVNKNINQIAKEINPIVIGWMNYYGKFYKSALYPIIHHINVAITRWVKKKYKRFRRRFKRAMRWLGRIAKRNPELFGYWKILKPSS